MHSGMICIVDADSDDRQIIQDIAEDLRLPNEIRFFPHGQDLIDYLYTVDETPFIILCEVNLPRMDGFELRSKLLGNADERFHSVPFVFWSTVASDAQVKKAFDLSAHGFFIKPPSFVEMERDFKTMLSYWQTSRMPVKQVQS